MKGYGVRIEFTWRGERLYDVLGPFDRFFAELVCIGYATAEHLYGLDWCRVERARIVPMTTAERETNR